MELHEIFKQTGTRNDVYRALGKIVEDNKEELNIPKGLFNILKKLVEQHERDIRCRQWIMSNYKRRRNADPLPELAEEYKEKDKSRKRKVIDYNC